MKNTYLIFSCLISLLASAQIVPCRPKFCLIDYNYHNDNVPNADKTAILDFKPDILIDNTPGGYWGEINEGTGCIPADYTAIGIKVFSYIAGGWESTNPSPINDLTLNLARIDAIAADGATGVFLDQVSHHPDATQKEYLTAIFNQCQLHNLELIFNPGTTSFDSWLMDHCDYLMSDEHYDGTRDLSASESGYADRILVVNTGIYTAIDAVNITQGAQAHGFGYSYACIEYTSLPPYLSEYNTIVSDPSQISPEVTLTNNMLTSDYVFGNQWFNGSGVPINGATGQTFVPEDNGEYYTIVTISGCATGASNTINYSVAGLELDNAGEQLTVYPNPARTALHLELNSAEEPEYVTICDITGKIVLRQSLSTQTIDVEKFSNGLYLVQVYSNGEIYQSKFIKL